MRSRTLVTTLAAVAVPSVEAAMGPAFSTGPVATNSFIREAISTLVLPKVPSGGSGDTSLWVGMGTSNGDLIQSIADNWQSSSWNIFAYTLMKTGRASKHSRPLVCLSDIPMYSQLTEACASTGFYGCCW